MVKDKKELDPACLCKVRLASVVTFWPMSSSCKHAWGGLLPRAAISATTTSRYLSHNPSAFTRPQLAVT